MLRDHGSVSRITQEFRGGESGAFVAYWVVYTRLELDALHPAYDLAKVNELLEAVEGHCKDHPDLRGRIIVRQDLAPPASNR